MSYVLVILPVAELEAAEAAMYYEDQKIALGTEFLDELENARALLSDHPQHYSYISANNTLRSIALKRFPYQLIFRIEGKHVIVISVRHEKQKPFR